MSGKKKKSARRPHAVTMPLAASRPLQAREVGLRELKALKRELARASGALGDARAASPRWNADPEDVHRSVARLVLSLLEFIRKLLERQAIRRMDAGTMTADEIERVGLSLMQLEKTLHGMAKRFGLRPEELNLDLGPLGRLH